MSKSRNYKKNRDNFDEEENFDRRRSEKPRRQNNQNWTKTYLEHQDDEEYEEIFNGKK